MTSARYCTYCDRDTVPGWDGNCFQCGRAFPRGGMTDAQVTAGAEALLARYVALEEAATARQAEAQRLSKAEVKVLRTVDKHGRVLGAWNDAKLGKLRLAGFVGAEALRNATGAASSTYLWLITDAGRRFLLDERAGR